MTFVMMLLAFLALIPVTGRAETASVDSVTGQAVHDSTKNHYVIVFTMGPGFVEGAGSAQPGRAKHVQFIKAAHADGLVPLAGALFEGPERTEFLGLLYFVRASSLTEARSIVMKEPLVQEKVVEISSIQMFARGIGRLD